MTCPLANVSAVVMIQETEMIPGEKNANQKNVHEVRKQDL